MKLREWIARHMRMWADRIHHPSAPKFIGYSFTFEYKKGIVFRDDRKGCPLMIYDDESYELAHRESDTMGY